MKRGRIEISLRCNACRQVRPEKELDCVSYRPVETVTTFFRYCKDKPQCKEIAEMHRKHKLLS
jgi:hypothetical protein